MPQQKQGALRRAAASLKRLFARGHNDPDTHETASRSTAARDFETPLPRPRPEVAPIQERPIRRETDIPLETIERTWTPQQTSVKAGFRASGDDLHRDQEFAEGFADDRFNDEDRLTNRSGDPRIGTHGRTYEPGEASTRSNE